MGFQGLNPHDLFAGVIALLSPTSVGWEAAILKVKCACVFLSLAFCYRNWLSSEREWWPALSPLTPHWQLLTQVIDGFSSDNKHKGLGIPNWGKIWGIIHKHVRGCKLQTANVKWGCSQSKPPCRPGPDCDKLN